MRGNLRKTLPSSGAFRATFSPKGEGFFALNFTIPCIDM